MVVHRRTFIVRVLDGAIVVEDFRVGRRARVDELDAVGLQIGSWLADDGSPAPAAPPSQLTGRADGARRP
ncbi:MAG: hypothetical protein WD844_15405 [Thermoleophilaceae bacterium]